MILSSYRMGRVKMRKKEPHPSLGELYGVMMWLFFLEMMWPITDAINYATRTRIRKCRKRYTTKDRLGFVT